ncbi:hypothetical protein DN752_23095 [Echinicola strongylocentroti]|uniref:Alginate lyase domain-containing protein n=1 Tax=Echinicola strongylocentroti TaxID=1795355 RepID=A0A2Z4IQG9_9BACT|nr:hypothetical protein DN752_23095 [Echinicola strongylocentroti]
MNKLLNIVLLQFIVFSAIANENKKINSLSKAANAGEEVVYEFDVSNNSAEAQAFRLMIATPRELTCEYLLEDSLVSLSPGETYEGRLKVIVSDQIPIGAYESASLLIKSANEVKRREFVTVRSRQHPFVLVTEETFTETKQKINDHSWARENLDDMLQELERFDFPEKKIISKPRPTKVWSSFNYQASDGEMAFKYSLAWKLTGEDHYLDKVVEFVKTVCDREEGYLSIGAATSGVQVHEGNFFLFLAAACDIIYNEPSFSSEDRENINATFRYYLAQNRQHMNSLGIMNHQASANAGALLVALFLQDIPEIHHLIEADGAWQIKSEKESWQTAGGLSPRQTIVIWWHRDTLWWRRPLKIMDGTCTTGSFRPNIKARILKMPKAVLLG